MGGSHTGRPTRFEALERRALLAVSPVAADDSYQVMENEALYAPFASSSDATAAGIAWNARIQLAGPLHWWRFDEDSGSTAYDHGSTRKDGIYVGNVTRSVPGLVGPAAEFDGTGFVRVEEDNLSTDWTMESIFAVDLTVNRVSQGLLGSSHSAGIPHGMAIKAEQYPDTGQLGYTQFFVRDASLGVPSPTQLTHVVMVGTENGVDLFVDGIHVGHDSMSITLGRFVIAATNADRGDVTASEPMVGVIDEMVIYDRALSAIEIKGHYDTLSAPTEPQAVPVVGILANDSDEDGDAITALLESQPAHGTLDLRQNGTFLYRPDIDYQGADQFMYRATDGTGSSNVAVVNILVQPEQDPPVAVDDQYYLPAAGPLLVPVAQGLVTNDTSFTDDFPLTAIVTQLPDHGTLKLLPDGSFEYVPSTTFDLVDQFRYRVTDGHKFSTDAIVDIQLNIPTIVVGDHVLQPNTPGQLIQLFVNGGQSVSGTDLYVQIGDGGPELTSLGLPAGTDGPAITSVDLKSGTIFGGVADSSINLGSLPQLANWTISMTGGGTVAASGLLATLEIDTTGFFEGDWEVNLTDVLPSHPSGPLQTVFANSRAIVVNGSISIVPATVVGRYVFYNDSAYDDLNPQANAADDLAIATDKHELLPGANASLANYTSYSRGLNGIMFDIEGLPADKQWTATDISFRAGRSADPANWTSTPFPEIATRPGAGIDGSDRVTLIWPDNAIENLWLEVRIKSGAGTNLSRDDVFYFGNAIGETGNDADNTFVTSIDVIGARDHQRGPFDLASIDNVYDFNRDRLVTSVDVIAARDHQSGALTSLPLITAPAVPVSAVAAVFAGDSKASCQPTPAANPRVTVSGHRLGDVNFDGVFDSSDLVQVFQHGKFEVSRLNKNATWLDGDWDGDCDFDIDDLIAAIQAEMV